MTAPFHESTIQVPSGGVFGESQSGASGAIGSNLYGTGTPEGVIAAKIGTVYRDVTPAAAKIYVKTSGTSTTGWEAIGGTSGTSLVLLSAAFTFADHVALKTPGIDLKLAGVARPLAIGDRILNAWIEPDPDTPFDGTTPLGDIFADITNVNSGLLNNAGGVTALDAADNVFGGLRFSSFGVLDFVAEAGNVGSLRTAVSATAINSLKVIATQSGKPDGTAIDSAQGIATAYALILPV